MENAHAHIKETADRRQPVGQRTHFKPVTIQRIRITREGFFMNDFNSTPPKGTRPLDPPEVQDMYQKILSAGIHVVRPSLKNDYERTLFYIALERFKGSRAA